MPSTISRYGILNIHNYACIIERNSGSTACIDRIPNGYTIKCNIAIIKLYGTIIRYNSATKRNSIFVVLDIIFSASKRNIFAYTKASASHI